MSSVEIENRKGWTSLKCARRYVAQGRAVWVRTSGRKVIRFIESDYRHQSAMRVKAGDLYRAGKDGLARPDQIAGLPTTGQPERLYVIGRAGKFAWTASVSISPLQNRDNNESPADRMQVARARYAR